MEEKKKARTVEIAPDQVLTYEQYEDYFRHARNSSMWYLGRFPSHSVKIRQRLVEKGYPKDDVAHLNSDGEVEHSNLIDLTMAELELLHMLNDELYIESKLKGTISKGKGTSLAVRELKYAGIPEEEIEAVLETIEDELDSELEEAVAKAAAKLMRSTPFRKAAMGWQRSMVLSGGLRAKGFDRDTVDNWMDDNAEIFEDIN